MLWVNDLVVGYRRTPVAKLARLSVEAGNAALLLGPSGSGKTSVLLGLAGLAKIFSGKANLDGVEIDALPPAGRDRFRGCNVGFVFQDLHLIAGLSTLDNVLLAPFASRVAQDRERARSLLDTLGLGQLVNRPAETLSRGQAQRASIARAMLLRPKLILADEPTASLDDEACQTVGRLLLDAAAQTSAALVIATHDLRLKALVTQTVAVEAAP